MKRLGTLVALVTMGVLLSTQVADACGDKFLLVGRGMKYQRSYAAIYRANILLYSGPTAAGRASVMQDAKFHAALTSAGHQLTVVQSAEAVKAALRAGSYEVILTEITQATNLGAEAEFAATKSLLLPVVEEKPSKQQIETCKRLFPSCKLKSSGKALSFLEVIDKEMGIRAKEQAKKKQ